MLSLHPFMQITMTIGSIAALIGFVVIIGSILFMFRKQFKGVKWIKSSIVGISENQLEKNDFDYETRRNIEAKVGGVIQKVLKILPEATWKQEIFEAIRRRTSSDPHVKLEM